MKYYFMNHKISPLNAQFLVRLIASCYNTRNMAYLLHRGVVCDHNVYD